MSNTGSGAVGLAAELFLLGLVVAAQLEALWLYCGSKKLGLKSSD